MKEKFENIANVAANVGKNAVGVLGKAKDKAVQVIDQNDDGKFDLHDVSDVAGNVSGIVKRTAANVKQTADERSRRMELKNLQPIFVDDLDSAEFSMTKLIRVCEEDKKHKESEVCQGAIGFVSDQKELKYINVYRKNHDDYGVTFVPDSSSEFYYVDPSDRDRYIALDEYFAYLKIARVNELQKIAQDLGAKHFKVTYKEEKTSFSNKSVKGHAKAQGAGYNVASDGEVNQQTNDYSTVEIAAMMECAGHAPIKPTLKYLQKDPSIQSLISLRMDEHAPITHHSFTLKLSNTSGIKESDAIKIDAVLKGHKCAGNATVVSEVQNESRRFFEYEIDF